MSLPSPTVVYRTRNYQEAESAAACLLRAGINARLNSPKPIGHMVEGPVFDILHEVLVADCTEAEVEQLLSQWRSKNRSIDPNKPPFCYHCGETLTSMIAVCPACGSHSIAILKRALKPFPKKERTPLSSIADHSHRDQSSAGTVTQCDKRSFMSVR